LILALITAVTCIAYADTGVPAVPEIQGISTGTSSDVIGTVTETDSAVWTLTKTPGDGAMYVVTYTGGPIGEGFYEPQAMAHLTNAGGSYIYATNPEEPFSTLFAQLSVPESLLNQPIEGMGQTWQDLINEMVDNWYSLTINQGGIHAGVLDPGQVQYTTGYNDQYNGISGQQTFTKSVGLSTANTIADQSNIKADTSVQFIAVDMGRATRTEDLLLDGAGNTTNGENSILCPLVAQSPSVIPAFCNIEQAGSAFDTSLTSTVTSADSRFVSTIATIPVVLNYNINSQGITLSDGTSSPMIGSVSAYMKIHIQESRNDSTSYVPSLITIFFGDEFTVPDSPVKSEDLSYSETSTASGLIGRFSKSMSYSSQASAVPSPLRVNPQIPL